MKTFSLFLLYIFFLLIFFVSPGSELNSEEIPYGVGNWDASKLGNHRAVVHVRFITDAASVRISWRRKDTDPQKKNIIVLDAKTGSPIDNVFLVDITREYGDLIFQPISGPGDYYVYYMPYIQSGNQHYPTVTYPEPKQTAREEWLLKNRLTSIPEVIKRMKQFSEARCVEIQSIDSFNSFYPMEVIVTNDELQILTSRYRSRSYILFPEDRKNPIRMTDDLPYKWVQSDAQLLQFKGEAARGEYYSFQIGVYAYKKAIPNIETIFGDLKQKDGKTSIPASAFTCFNLGGVNWGGQEFKKTLPVEKGKIQSLWFGVQVPKDLSPGLYEGRVTIVPQGMERQTVHLQLNVNDQVFDDSGDSEPWRHSRLRWLNSTRGADDDIIPPFTPMTVKNTGDETVIGCLGRAVRIGKTAFPTSIKSWFSPGVTEIPEGDGKEILAAPFSLVIEDTNCNILSWESKGCAITKNTPGAVEWKAECAAAASALSMNCEARMEFDGFVRFHVILRASKPFEVNDIRLEIPMLKDVAKYMMGLGLKGGFRPTGFKWKWDVEKNQDSAWLGDVNAGLQFNLRDNLYSRPLNTNFYHSKPLVMPVSWQNQGRGGVDISEKGDHTVLINAYSGARTLKAGEELHFYFNLLLTPFKTVDTLKQWSNRFYHRFDPLKDIEAKGANVVNVHHATEINPFINYPFLRPNEMKAYIDDAHNMGMKVKIYDTIRELSNHAVEIFALRSMGNEVVSEGPGGGFSWLQEHIGSNYIAGWFVPGLMDAAIINSGMSRWHNYYIEGLDWLAKNVGIDGLYIDDVAFDRDTMKRARKVLERRRSGILIDFHSANQFNRMDGFANSANLYMEHFPYIDRLWFGEYFDYNSSPDSWLIEMSGIPFGLMGEMLQDNGNPWRGMIYGMTNRLPWAGDPSPLWKAWDDFGIQQSRMLGYWNPLCPIKTGRPDVLATAYVKEGKTLVAVAGWAKDDVKCKLIIDWKALGLEPKKSRLTAPAIKDFQNATVFKPTDEIPVPAGKGWLFIIK